MQGTSAPWVHHGAEVPGPVELPHDVVVGRVQANGHNAATQVFGKPVVVLPAVCAALVRVAVRAHPFKRHEHRLAGLGHLSEPDPATLAEIHLRRALCSRR